ncbi:purine/pyrimidine permease [Bacillus sp. WP8]|uniref:purine/pyrimidine permease n=1 Tax=Bacillus sp. WP8 TaxID=756828 RepID=UPI0016429875
MKGFGEVGEGKRGGAGGFVGGFGHLVRGVMGGIGGVGIWGGGGFMERRKIGWRKGFLIGSVVVVVISLFGVVMRFLCGLS